ncbi:hypothetical protein [Streptomyces sp. NPDC048350]|uniref:hypothetical protein n=1 Tax=Streptomyces sp. NPDC048350 TaxID=3365538 RepID=UPI00372467E7
MVPTAAPPRTRIAGLAARARSIVDSGLCTQTSAVPDWLTRLDQLEPQPLPCQDFLLDVDLPLLFPSDERRDRFDQYLARCERLLRRYMLVLLFMRLRLRAHCGSL